jgi:hypothetical protein
MVFMGGMAEFGVEEEEVGEGEGMGKEHLFMDMVRVNS